MLQRTLAEVKSVAIGGHIRPDGDCVGSCMAMYQYIRTWYPETDVDVYLVKSKQFRYRGRQKRFHMK